MAYFDKDRLEIIISEEEKEDNRTRSSLIGKPDQKRPPTPAEKIIRWVRTGK